MNDVVVLVVVVNLLAVLAKIFGPLIKIEKHIINYILP